MKNILFLILTILSVTLLATPALAATMEEVKNPTLDDLQGYWEGVWSHEKKYDQNGKVTATFSGNEMSCHFGLRTFPGVVTIKGNLIIVESLGRTDNLLLYKKEDGELFLKGEYLLTGPDSFELHGEMSLEKKK